MPQNVLLAKSITVLRLKASRLESYFGDINLSSLKILSLYKVGTNDQIIQNLVSGCPVIEDIGIEDCRGLKVYSSLVFLKTRQLS